MGIVCQVCSNLLASDSHLIFHYESFHQDQGKFKCHRCDFITDSSSDFKTHFEKQHKYIWCVFYECEICGYRANRNSLMQRHKHLKHDTRPYKCDKCNYATFQKSGLKRHINVRHENIWLMCEDCDYLPESKWQLTRHMRKEHHKIKRGQKYVTVPKQK